jgi:Ras-related protein Rab-2A
MENNDNSSSPSNNNNDNIICEALPEDYSAYDLSFKLIVIGDSSVGKSCLTMKATKNFFEEFYNPTVGFEFFTFNVKVNDKAIKLQIWDTCGQEVYRSLIQSFYRNSSLAMMVYEIDKKESFDNLNNWYNEIREQSNPDIKIFLIGNKTDLEENRQVTKEEANSFVQEHNIDFFIETSAKTGFNAQNVFLEAAKTLYLEHLKYKDRASRTTSLLNNSILKKPLENSINEEEIEKKESKCPC